MYLCQYSSAENCTTGSSDFNGFDANETEPIVETVVSTIGTTVINITTQVAKVNTQLSSTVQSTVFQGPLATDKPPAADPSTSHILAYVLVPLGSLILIAVLSFLVSRIC